MYCTEVKPFYPCEKTLIVNECKQGTVQNIVNSEIGCSIFYISPNNSSVSLAADCSADFFERPFPKPNSLLLISTLTS